MKKYILCGAVIALCSCVNEGNLELSNSTIVPKYLSVSSEEVDTRTYVENKSTLHWNENDEISYFPGVTTHVQYRFIGDEGAVSGLFERVGAETIGGTALACNYAVYPYSALTNIASDGTISYNMPATQGYKEESFGAGSNVMVSVTKDKSAEELKFKNVCGYLTLQLYGENTTVKSVSLKGNNNEKIAGPATIKAFADDTPIIEMLEDAVCELTIDCGDGLLIGDSQENATTFWFVLPTVEFSKGFTITVTDTKGGVFEKSTANLYKIDRNMIQPMKALAVLCEKAKPANNEIWYTSNDGAVVTPRKTDVFGANIVSNTYENGQGLIIFDGPVTSIGRMAFYCCSSLTSITIPDSVTSIGEETFRGCSSFASITIGRGITSIGSYAFYGCTGELIVNCNMPDASDFRDGTFYGSDFTKVTIGDSVTSIGSYTFSCCSSLISITIPDSVTSIRSFAFYECSSLTSITIPNSVTSIRRAFDSCSSLISIYCKPTTPPAIYYFYYANFDGTKVIHGAFPFNSDMKIYVPYESYDAYIGYTSSLSGSEEQTNWSKYKSYITPYNFE